MRITLSQYRKPKLVPVWGTLNYVFSVPTYVGSVYKEHPIYGTGIGGQSGGTTVVDGGYSNRANAKPNPHAVPIGSGIRKGGKCPMSGGGKPKEPDIAHIKESVSKSIINKLKRGKGLALA